ncbi:hypothetical protein [Melittangium boletus]|uniref:hypothetical protein n=1 Tax=Melittangium boletus TaxID=83453 RepID=UPI003DA3622F
MKKSLGVMCLSLLGAAFATGRGDARAEEPPAQAVSGGEEVFTPIAPEQDDSGLGQEQEDTAFNQNRTVGQCCHVKCSNGSWYGPFASVRYNSCPEYGRYYCPAHKHGSYSTSSWKGC